MEQLPEVLPTVDPDLGVLIRAELTAHGVDVLPGTTVRRVSRAEPEDKARLRVEAVTAAGETVASPSSMPA